MSWSAAKRDARIRVAAMLERVAAFPSERRAVIRLTDYEDEESYQFLCGMAGPWSLDYFKMVNSAAARELRQRGFKVDLVPIKMAGYFDWLAREGLENKTENRAAFIAQATL